MFSHCRRRGRKLCAYSSRGQVARCVCASEITYVPVQYSSRRAKSNARALRYYRERKRVLPNFGILIPPENRHNCASIFRSRRSCVMPPPPPPRYGPSVTRRVVSRRLIRKPNRDVKPLKDKTNEEKIRFSGHAPPVFRFSVGCRVV